MRTPGFHKLSGAATALVPVLLFVVLMPLKGCTDLGEQPFSAITPENFYQNEEEVMGGLMAVYAQLRGAAVGAYYNLNQISSDEQVIPTRGQDWYDNGRWLEIQRQTWAANSPSGLSDVNGAWNAAYTGVARANVLLSALETVAVANRERTIAEVRVLRAYYYYILMDLFGGVPIATDSAVEPRERATRADVFNFIEAELIAAQPALPDAWPGADYGRVTKGVADAILASMYLNAEVFTGTVTAAGLQRGTPRWQDAIDAADRVINSPAGYMLASDWHANFRHDNHTSPEIIFPVTYLNASGLGLGFISQALHYNQFSPSPNNGRAAQPDTYAAFDPDDARFDIFLAGPQFHIVTGAPVNDRAGQRLVFTPEIQDVTQATEGEGVRIYKWPYDPGHSGTQHGNDFTVFRLAEMHLIKAEALNELNQTGQAVAEINTIRARVFDPPKPLNAGAFDQASLRERILQERLFELTAESKRRQDLIRHGKYTDPWFAKEQREPFRVLMPIPQPQLNANPLLDQNPGY